MGVTTLDNVVTWNQKTFPDMIEVCKDYLFVHRVGIYFQKNSHLTQQINSIIRVFQFNGLIERWENDVYNRKYLVRPPPTKGAKYLDLNQLSGCFIILVCGYLIAFLAFVMEYMSLKF